ncbi:MAG: protein-glutamate O-methyltransferase [Zoogloea sp.]|nr:protein-glutamate O-methyltransferase [Zoogloea sp.]
MTGSPEISDLEFDRIRKLLYEITGISLADNKKVMLVGRLMKRLRHYGLSSFSEYFHLVTSGSQPEERQLMVDLLTTNETYFFREEKHFAYLAENILSRHPPGRPFELWSAACSTGEEVYSLAMVLAERFGVNGAWNILGSDISMRVLETARHGQYSMQRTSGIPPDLLRKYCLKGVRSQEGTLLIDSGLRRQVSFMQVNLNEHLPRVGPFDVIFLRNVMIYFDTETKRKVVNALAERLRPGGYLFIGHSESLFGVTDVLKAVQPTIYRKV